MREFGLVPREEMMRLTGLELMQGLIAGKYPWPPIMRALDFCLDRVEPGVAVFSGEGKLTDARGKLLAHGTTTCLVLGG